MLMKVQQDVTFTVSLPYPVAYQLAQFIKRAKWYQCRDNATSDDEAYEMMGALNAIGRELADRHGIAPR